MLTLKNERYPIRQFPAHPAHRKRPKNVPMRHDQDVSISCLRIRRWLLWLVLLLKGWGVESLPDVLDQLV